MLSHPHALRIHANPASESAPGSKLTKPLFASSGNPSTIDRQTFAGGVACFRARQIRYRRRDFFGLAEAADAAEFDHRGVRFRSGLGSQFGVDRARLNR